MLSTAPPAHDNLRQEVQEAKANAAELRALHAALLQGGGVGSPVMSRLPVESSSLSLSRAFYPITAEDYPVFRLGREGEPVPAYHHFHSRSQTLLETLSRIGLEMGEDGKGDSSVDEKETTVSSMSRGDPMFSTPDSEKSHLCSCTDHATLQKTSTMIDTVKPTGGSFSAEFKVVATCNRCKPATISRGADFERKQNYETTISAVQGSATHQPSLQPHKNRRLAVLSWLFPPFKRKPKSEIRPATLKPEDKSQNVEDWRTCSLKALKKELIDASETRDAALAEVGEMRSSLKCLQQKLLHVEAYCEELKKALKQSMQGKDALSVEKRNMARRTKTTGGRRASLMPVSHEVMLEGFLQMVSEARLSVKRFCKALLSQSEETDVNLIEKLDMLIRPNDLTSNSRSRHSKDLQYHLEALINQALYEDFENCVFRMNGSQKILDPQQDCQENFSAFVSLRSSSWKEAILREGSRCYSEDLCRFVDRRMSAVVSTLGWPRPWPEQLCHPFFVAAKCIWLLHLLAFSFRPPLAIWRVEENRSFDPLFMEDILSDRHRVQAPAHVKIMVAPGFYAHDRLVRCKVLCSYR